VLLKGFVARVSLRIGIIGERRLLLLQMIQLGIRYSREKSKVKRLRKTHSPAPKRCRSAPWRGGARPRGDKAIHQTLCL
jgi:hypothetical protein